ncbi:MAG: hypothetical protein LCH62_01890, partial [Proteobacteria bacterium]|nr:hypothetical protein [Pseudomonadota bacterium]
RGVSFSMAGLRSYDCIYIQSQPETQAPCGFPVGSTEQGVDSRIAGGAAMFGELALLDQHFVAADAVAAMLLGVVQAAVGEADHVDRRHARLYPGEADAAADLADLGELVLLDGDGPVGDAARENIERIELDSGPPVNRRR